MYLYNVSIIVEETQHDELIKWVKNEWIPSLQQADVKFLKMIDSPHEGHTYCIQLVFDEKELVKEFQEKHLLTLQYQIGNKHAEKAFIFDSTMQYLSL